MRAILILAGLALIAAAPAYERWDTKLNNHGGWRLFEEDIAHGGKPAFANGEWQGNFAFQLSNCPGRGCRTWSGEILAVKAGPGDEYLGQWTFPDAACRLDVREGVDRFGMNEGFVFKLKPTDAAGQGCAAVPRTIAGDYQAYWINHAKMAAQSAAAAP